MVGYICTHLKIFQVIRKMLQPTVRRLKQFLDFPVTVPCSTCCKKTRFDLSACDSLRKRTIICAQLI